MQLPRIAVVGNGIVSPLGESVDIAWRRLMAGEGAVRRCSFDSVPDVAAAPVDVDLSSTLTKLQQVGTERVSLMALRAARHAMADADLADWDSPDRVGLFVGTGMGGASTMDEGYAALYSGRKIPPLTVPSGMVNGAAAVVAMHTGIRGPVLTYAVACASSAVAIAEAAHCLRRGEIDIAIAGGVEALLVKGTIVAWQALRTLAPPCDDDPGRSCQPFSPTRSGLVLGEGAAFLVLVREQDVRRNVKEPYAWLSGSAVRCDAHHLTNPDIGGQERTLAAALEASGLRADNVGYCNAHGTGTLAGDPVECEALRRVWGDASAQLHVSSTKAAHGHLLGAAGAMEAVWTVQALHRAQVPPTRGVEQIAPECHGLDHVLAEGREVPGLRHAISNSFAFGGTNAALVFSRV